MRKKAFLALMLTLTIISSSGCQTEIKPADPKDGKYATQTSMTSLEYALYMNKQITVFTNQLSTRMAVAANHKDVQSSNESYMTQQMYRNFTGYTGRSDGNKTIERKR